MQGTAPPAHLDNIAVVPAGQFGHFRAVVRDSKVTELGPDLARSVLCDINLLTAAMCAKILVVPVNIKYVQNKVATKGLALG